MANKKLVETIYGRRSKFEIYKNSGLWDGTNFLVYKDGVYWKKFDTLSSAVESSKKE